MQTTTMKLDFDKRDWKKRKYRKGYIEINFGN